MLRDLRVRAAVLALVLPALSLAQPVVEDPDAAPPAASTAPAPVTPQGAPVTAPTPRPNRVVAGLRGDVLGGGWIAAALLSASANAVVRELRGEKPGAAATHAVRDLTRPEFLVGNLVAGSAGAALGAALPLPALARAPLFLRSLGSAAAPLALAALAATVTTTAISLHRHGHLTASNLLHSVDWANLAAQTVGSLVGMSLGTTLVGMGLAPALALGSVAIVPLLGGIAGSIAGAELLHWFRSRRVDPSKGAAAANPASATAPDVVPGKDAGGATPTEAAPIGAGNAGLQPPSANVVSNVAVADPFADLPNSESTVEAPVTPVH